MAYPQFFTLLGVFTIGVGIICRQLKQFQIEIREDIKNQSNRSDQLYEMFYELLKEGKK